MRSLLRSVAVLLVAVLGATVLVSVPSTPAAAAPASERVLVVSDSVGLGAKTAMPRAFPASWEVNVIGTPAMFVEQLEASHVRPTIAGRPSWVGDHVVIAGGYNYPYWDPARFDRSIDSMINTLTAAGVKNVYWVTLREVKPQYISASAWRQVQPYYWYFPTVNEHLQRALSRHPNLTLIDWAANADRPGLTYDAIHLNSTGAALYSSLVARQVHNANTRQPNGATLRVPVGDGSATSAVAMNLTANGTRMNGHFTAWSCDQPRPPVSNLNHSRDHTVAAAALVPVGPGGEVCIANTVASQVIVDLTGRFRPGADLIGSPRRLVDTRQPPRNRPVAGRTPLKVRIADDLQGVPPAVALNITAAGAGGLGNISVHSCAAAPGRTSTLNYRRGVATPNVTVVRPDPDGSICITPTSAVHLIVDRFAVFGSATTVRTNAPLRAIDTRVSGPVPAENRVVRIAMDELGLAGDPADGVALNLTVTGTPRPGFASAYGCADGRPPTSNVNFVPGAAIANFVVVRPDAAGDICIFTRTSAHVIVDVLATTGGGFDGIRPQRLVDTRTR